MSKEKKLSKDELIEELDTMLFRACADCFEHEPSQVAKPMEKKMGQACEQLKQLIKAQAEPSEEWIEEKEREMQDIIQMFALESQGKLKGKSDLFKVSEDFIRNLLKEVPMRKPKVSKAFVEEMIDESVYILHEDKFNFYKRKFKEAGHEVEK